MDFKEFALLDKPEDRKKREIKAASAECIPISVDPNNLCGVFGGSSGNYNTSLSECECVDFHRRKLPCKHMYRLAHELGLYSLDDIMGNMNLLKGVSVSSKKRADALEQVIALMETYNKETQLELQSVLSDRYGGMTHICKDAALLEKPLSDGLLETVDSPKTIIERNYQKTTVENMLAAGFNFPEDVKTTKKARYLWCLDHPDIACAYAYPTYFVVQPAGILELAHTKAYTYLNKKFPKEYIFFKKHDD